MAMKQTEWKSIHISKETLDFTGATNAALENDGNEFLSLTLKLRTGKTVRLRKHNYGVVLEEPLVPMDTKYVAATTTGLRMTFSSESEAQKALSGIDGDVTEIQIPRETPQLLFE